MYPEPVFTIFGRGINLYLIFGGLGILLGAALTGFFLHKRGCSRATVWGSVLVFVVAVVAGAELFAFFPVKVRLVEGSQEQLIQISPFGRRASGASFVVGTFLLYLFFWLRRETSFRPMAALDCAMPGFALAYTVGVLGCLSAGCCHGKPAFGLPWAVIFNKEGTACIYPGVPVHPVQIYDILSGTVIFLVLLWCFLKGRARERLLWIGFLLYGVSRFTTGFFRGDPRPFWGPFSVNQWLALCLALVGGFFLLRGILSSEKKPEEVIGDAYRGAF